MWYGEIVDGCITVNASLTIKELLALCLMEHEVGLVTLISIFFYRQCLCVIPENPTQYSDFQCDI